MDNTCIVCGASIPGEIQICIACEDSLKNYKPNGVKTKKIKKFVWDDNFIQLTIDDMEVADEQKEN